MSSTVLEVESDSAPKSEEPIANKDGLVQQFDPSDPRLLAKIMIIDDEAYNIMVVRKFLKTNGYRNFVTTTEPKQAIEIMRQEYPDLILLDIRMPELSGFDILELVRTDSELKNIPVIILTAAAEAAGRRHANVDR